MTASRSSRTYLFILCPAFSGSTVLYRLIASSPHASTLFGHGNWAGEGQFVPAVVPLMRRQVGADPRVGGWEDPAVEMPWGRIRREWERCWDLSKPVLVEKSPPNVLRAPAIEEHFSRFGDVRFVAMIRSPYHVRQRPELWLAEARHQRRNVETLRHVLWTRYEDLCRDPAAVARRLTDFLPALGPLDHTAARASRDPSVAGRTGPIASRNATTRSLATQRDLELAPHEELLRFFGYEPLTAGSAAWEREPWLPEIEVERSYAAPPGEVYRAWIEPPLLARWWGNPRSDARVGGEYSLAPYAGAESLPRPVAGRYLELDEGRRLRFTWRLREMDYLLDDSNVEVDLRPLDGGGTRLVLRSLTVARFWYRENERFWKAKLEQLGEALTGARK
jgi:uncharacterized protein YndB with AHSA1/START domain